MHEPKRYGIGQSEIAPYNIILEIKPIGLTVEQFMSDLPRLAARLEAAIIEAHAESERSGQ